MGSAGGVFVTDWGSFPVRECWRPKRQAVIATIYYVSFTILVSFVIFSFFIGAVVGGMADALEEFEKSEAEEKLRLTQKLSLETDPK